jgi:hypothetical protein
MIVGNEERPRLHVSWATPDRAGVDVLPDLELIVLVREPLGEMKRVHCRDLGPAAIAGAAGDTEVVRRRVPREKRFGPGGGRRRYRLNHLACMSASCPVLMAGRVLTVPLEGFTHGQGFEPKNSGFVIRQRESGISCGVPDPTDAVPPLRLYNPIPVSLSKRVW